MVYQAISTKCPNCGTPIDIDNPVCESCGTKLYITNYDTFFNMPQQMAQNYANAYREPLAARPNDGQLSLAAAMCFLRLHLYDQSMRAFERAMADDMNNAELYFYAAVALLKGKRPFLAGRAAILKIEEYVVVLALTLPAATGTTVPLAATHPAPMPTTFGNTSLAVTTDGPTSSFLLASFLASSIGILLRRLELY